jgi:predicted Rossmann-fold nucleotide-binding protein
MKVLKFKGKIDVVYGGGQLGLMGLLAKTAHENGSKVTAVIPPIFKTDSVHVTTFVKLSKL